MSGGACQLGTSGSDGTFTVIGLHSGAYTVIAYPPAGAGGEQSPPVQITVTYPNAVTGIQLQLPATAVMPRVDVDQRRCDPTGMYPL